jgi:hypothetical protein
VAWTTPGGIQTACCGSTTQVRVAMIWVQEPVAA